MLEILLRMINSPYTNLLNFHIRIDVGTVSVMITIFNAYILTRKLNLFELYGVFPGHLLCEHDPHTEASIIRLISLLVIIFLTSSILRYLRIQYKLHL